MRPVIVSDFEGVLTRKNAIFYMFLSDPFLFIRSLVKGFKESMMYRTKRNFLERVVKNTKEYYNEKIDRRYLAIKLHKDKRGKVIDFLSVYH